jgi:hypothetical protein
MNTYCGTLIGYDVICISKAHQNKVGKVVRFTGDGGKKKFEFALGDGQVFSVARQSIRKVVSPQVTEGVQSQVRVTQPQIATGMDEVMLDEAVGSMNLSSSDEIEVHDDDLERYRKDPHPRRPIGSWITLKVSY